MNTDIDKAPEGLEFHVEISDPEQTAVQVLAKASGLSNTLVKQAMFKGAVWLGRGKKTQRLRRASRALNVGDALHFYYNKSVLARETKAAELIKDEGDYSVWYKPYGMYSQGSKWGDHCTISRWAEQHLQPERPAFVVHRLDRAASGLILLAHSKRAAAALSGLFERRELDKTYWVIVEGKLDTPEAGLTIDSPVNNKEALSKARTLDYQVHPDQSLVEVKIETGRKHQIRIHMAAQGTPVVGDRLHGKAGKSEIKAELPERDLQLAAVDLKFVCPFSEIAKHYTLPDTLRPGFSDQNLESKT